MLYLHSLRWNKILVLITVRAMNMVIAVLQDIYVTPWIPMKPPTVVTTYSKMENKIVVFSHAGSQISYVFRMV